jgi:Lon protease-like protein
MQGELLPLFPLGIVLLPGARVPLHIFEERYKEMIGEAIARSSEFGIVMAMNEGIAKVGCSAVVENVLRRYPDGRLDIVVRGQERFEIESLDQERAYLRARVSYFGDEPSAEAVTESLQRRARQALEQLRAEAAAEEAEAGDEEDEPVEEEEGGENLSFQLAQAIDDLDFRQQLLVMRSEAERLQRIIDFLPEYVERRRQILHMKIVAPRNGHGRWPKGIEE